MGCTSSDTPDGGVTAVKIVVLARSDADLRRLIEPLVDHPLLTVRMEDSEARAGAPPVLLARLALGPDLVLYIFGALVPTPPEALRELASGAIGAVFADGVPRPALARRAGLAGLPSVATSDLVPHQYAPSRDARANAKRPFTALVQAAIDARTSAPR